MVKYEFRGREYSLYLSGLGLFECYEHFKDSGSLLELIEPDTKAAYEAAVWMLCKFSKLAALYQRYLGGEAAETLDYQEMLISVRPEEYPEIKRAVIRTIGEGFGREHPGEEDSDPWLQEYEAETQKKNISPGRNISGSLRRAWAFLSGRG